MTVETLRLPRPAEAGEKPLLEIEGGRGRASLASLRELWLYREVLAAFAARAVKVKYKQAAIGIGWAVLQPLAAAGLFALFLGRLSHLGSEGVPYLLFAFAGMTCWTYFSGAAGSAMDSLVQEAGLLRKVYFPREILPLAQLLAALVDAVPSVATLAVVAALYGVYPSTSWVLLPVPLLVLVLAAGALGLAVSGVNVYYRDVRHALPFVLQVGLFASPVVYSLSVVPAGWRTAYEILNPVAGAIDAMRRIVVHGQWPHAWPTAGAAAWSLVLLVVSYSLFKRIERGFSDRV